MSNDVPGTPRMVGPRLSPPWLSRRIKSDHDDYIPQEIRDRFAKKSPGFSLQAGGSGSSQVAPTDRVFWGADEGTILRTLQFGFVRRAKSTGKPGVVVAQLEVEGGGSMYAFVFPEKLRNPYARKIWGAVMPDNAILSMQAAAAYEVAKACGFDDVTAPTVYRRDIDGDFASSMPDSVASSVRDGGDAFKRQVFAHNAISLSRGKLWAVENEPWFQSLFSDADPDALNNIWEYLPDVRRSGMLRVALLDLITWNLERTWGDLLFTDDERHPVVSFGMEMSVACPRMLGVAYSSKIGSSFSNDSGQPLIASEAVSMLCLRGTDSELAGARDLADIIWQRMRLARAEEMCRSLLLLGVPPVSIAGVLSRIYLLAKSTDAVVTDPYFILNVYAEIQSPGTSHAHRDMIEFVNSTLTKAMVDKFDFAKAMKAKSS